VCGLNPASANGMRGAHAIFVRLLRWLQLGSGSDSVGARACYGYGLAGATIDGSRDGLSCMARPPSNGATTAFTRRSKCAFTLLEVMVAAGIFALVFTGLYAASNHVMNLIRRAEDSAVAQRNCLARVDQLRNSAWTKATLPSHIASLLAVPTGNAAFDKEVISVHGVPVPATVPSGTTPSPAGPTGLLFTVTRSGTEPPVISPPGFDQATVLDAFQLNFRVLTEWRRGERTAQRELSTIISKSASR
jgi:prepilin-type N-terminal cleavage/methylation domain-containing protein